MTSFPQIPGYRLEGELGRGGMATVYLAHEEKLDRLVALKVLELYSSQGHELAERFIREARTAARLQHSNIISIFDVGQAGNLNYIAMEYLPGGTLRDIVRTGAIGAVEALTIVQQLARALGYAHSQGYIHRDIKPENIMFRRDGTAVLTDFGIARAVGSATRLTKTGMSIGTPHYMSPEQARGLELDGRADLYSLGVVFYEMLTGRVPYEAEDSVAVAIKHIQEPVPELPPYLRLYQRLLDRMLAKDREERVGSGEELVRLIGKLGGGEAITAGATSRVSEREAERSPRAGRTPPAGVRGIRITVGRAERDTPGTGLGNYGEMVSRARRSWVVPALAGMLVVAVGALLYLVSAGGGPRSEAPLSAPSTQIEPVRPGERPSGTASSPSGKAAMKTSWEEEREREFGEYLTQARVLLAKGSLEEAQTSVELAESIRKGTAEAESLKRLIADAKARREQKRRDVEAARLAVERDNSAWAEAAALGTEQAYQRYLDSYPSGRNVSDARRRIEGIQATEAKRAAEPKAGDVWREAVTGMEFVWVPAGEFAMGSDSGEPDEKPVHRVYVDGFWLGRYEVTQGEWQAIIGANTSSFPKGDRYPVESVSWEAAQQFIARFNSRTGQTFRLPTEAEWEYACRAGTTGDRYGILDEIAWYLSNSGGSARPVGQKRPNAFGLYDMLGNVWEWCQDWYAGYPSGYARNPQGSTWGKDKVNRGGSWYFNNQGVRSAFRFNSAPNLSLSDIGFRLARTK